LREESALKSALIKLKYKRDTIDSFRRELSLADPESIDTFLESRPEFLKIGKLMIALNLIPYEDDSVLFGSKGSDQKPTCWYSYLMGKLRVRYFKDFQNNRLSIITFNYDRSLEHYLFTVLKHSYNVPDQDCADALDSIPIIHVHGSLGKLPWQGISDSRVYGRTDDLQKIQLASQQILVMSEKDEHSAVFDKAYGLMVQAERIYFLGFGYHETNLRRLGMEHLVNKTSKYGTSVGLGTAEWRSISNTWRITFKGDAVDILSLFKDHNPL
jgi:hypothetical protein